TLLVAPRLADGSLPDTDFLRLQPSSDLIDKGQNIGFAYSGAAPDLGAFEYQQQTPVDVLPVKSLLFFPDPVSDKLNFTGSSDKNIEIFNCEGKRMLNLKVTYSVDVSNLPAGIYIIRIKADDEKPVISKFIKR
ncbi:MAG TPA: T9SS type A sorting domain-containing protein, partial [Paludibacteraceae bacterium]|nr:T9SS type A sorting domain-containing protein [Paludibacteraceae bacterium]